MDSVNFLTSKISGYLPKGLWKTGTSNNMGGFGNYVGNPWTGGTFNMWKPENSSTEPDNSTYASGEPRSYGIQADDKGPYDTVRSNVSSPEVNDKGAYDNIRSNVSSPDIDGKGPLVAPTEPTSCTPLSLRERFTAAAGRVKYRNVAGT